ncbi:MAG: antibiotic biosynthesis monooxygenase [Alphaproteobacteria bacterium]|nr:antibiotic biosynthesis monooxygenase [Alphaproteobacteria bacterium]
MIVRLWHGRTKLSDGDAYEQFMKDRAAPDYGSVKGLQKIYFLRRNEDDVAHFLLVTHWDDMAAVIRFAGDDPDKAKYYPEDDRYLLEKEKHSQNYEVFFSQ